MADFLAGLPGPALLVVVAVLLTVEAGLLVGVLIPATGLTVTTAVVAQLTGVPLPWAVVAIAAGTVAGGQVGFRIGRRRRGEPTPFAGTRRVVPGAWPRIAEGLGRRPALAVAGGHWVSYARTIVPRTAGWSGVAPRLFTLAHTPSAVGWAATLTVVGYTATAAVRDGVSLAMGVLVGVVAAVVVGVVVVRAVRQRRGHEDPAAPRTV